MKKIMLPQVALTPVNGSTQLLALPAGNKGQPLLLNLASGTAPTLMTSAVVSPSLVQVSPGPVSRSPSLAQGTQTPLLVRLPTPATIISENQPQPLKLVETTSGKKLLLTNVVDSPKTPTLRAPVLVVQNAPVQKQVKQVKVLQKPVLSNVQPVIAANAPKTIVLQNRPTSSVGHGSKTTLMKVQGINKPLIAKKTASAVSQPPLISAVKAEEPEQKIPFTFVQSPSSTATTTITTTATNSTTQAPIIKTLYMLGSSNQLPFKVVGNPIPVRLGGNGKAAPKVPYKLVSTSSTQKLILAPTSSPVPVITTTASSPLRSCETVPSLKGTTPSSKAAVPNSLPASVDSVSPSKNKRAFSASPPAYLNIRIKVEPSSEGASSSTKENTDEGKNCASEADKENGPVTVDGVKIKEEPKEEEEEDLMMHPMSHLDVSIKEEPRDREDELLVKDQQLKELLKATQPERTKKKISVHPKFYLRTADEKLLPLDKETLKALGLHKDQASTDARKVASSLLQLQRAFTLPSNQHCSNKESEGDGRCLPLHKSLVPGDKCQSAEPAAVSNSVKKAETREGYISLTSCQSELPKTANVIDFVNRNVPEKPMFDISDNFSDLTSLQNLVSGSETSPSESCSYAFGRKHSSHIQKKISTTILGKHTVNGKTMIRISLESGEGGVDDVCDIELTSLNKFKCPFCGKEFKTKDHVISHIRVHTGERPYPCDVCGKRYRQRIDIIRHMRIHTGEKPFTCENCGASFNQKSNLRSHMRVHTGERPVQCKVCGKGFSRNTHLKQHMKLHTGEKPYKCSTCNRPFRFKSGLQAHERIHTGMKPYACSLCGRSFTQVVGLIRHEKTHTGEKPFRCQMCGKSFNNKENLQKHVRKHTGDRPFKCDLCGKTFTDNGALRCHRKKYHSNMLICVICLREDFKSRIELREHLRAHERENWHETPEGDLVPIIRGEDHQMLCVDDTQDSIVSSDEEEYIEDEDGEEDGKNEEEEKEEGENEEDFEEIQVEVELEPDDPMDDEVENSDFEEEHQLTVSKCGDGDSECGQSELQIELDSGNDPLG